MTLSDGKLKKNILYNILYQSSVLITPLLIAHHTAIVLGPENGGQYSFVQSVVSYFVLFATLGTTYYGQRTIAGARSNPIKLQKSFQEIVELRIITTIIAVILYYVFLVPKADNSQLWLFAGLEIFTVGLDISWFYQGLEEFRIIALTSICARLLSIFIIYLLIQSRSQLNLYVFLYCSSLLLGALAQWFFLYKYIDYKKWVAESSKLKTHLSVAIGLFVAQAAIQIYTVLDKTMIGLITNSSIQNGFYEEAQKLIRVLVAVSTSIGTVMASRVAFLWANRDEEQIKELLLVSFQIVSCLGSFIFIILPICSDQFVPLYYGVEYYGVIPLLRILSFQPIIIGFSSIIGMQFFVPTGREKLLTLSVSIGCCLNVIMNFFLIPHLQAAGAALASVFAELSVTGIQLFLAKKYLKIKTLPIIVGKYFVIAVLVMIIGYGIKKITLQFGMLACLLLVFVICGASYFTCLLLTGDPIIRALLGKIGDKNV